MKNITKLEVISFVTGFSLMTFELAAARILAPVVGSSMYVWTSVIGVIIAALSLGYFLGGNLADKRSRPSDVSILLILAATLITLCLVFQRTLFSQVQAWQNIDIRFQAVYLALILFAPASLVLGMISPYLAKLKIDDLSKSGKSIASLSVFNSIGGIFGTFLTGFVLFSYIGSAETIAATILVLLATSWLLVASYQTVLRLIVTTVLVCASLMMVLKVSQKGVWSIDTPSAHYQIVDFKYGLRPARGLLTGIEGIQSAVPLDGSKDLLFWYTKVLAEQTLAQKPQRILILGGGAFTLPEYLAKHLPDSQIDVVEIDPDLGEVAGDYFDFNLLPNIKIYAEDARVFVNKSSQVYDTVIVDVYSDGSIPFSVATREYGEAVTRLVAPNGVILANIIGGTEGPCQAVFTAISSAYSYRFPEASFQLNPASSARRANIIVRFADNNSAPKDFTRITLNPQNAFNDNYAPFERLCHQCRAALN